MATLDVRAQDVSINVLSSPASLPVSTTGSIQVDLCNTDPNNISVPVNKLNPQISVSSDVTILGVTKSDGSSLTDFTVSSNTGQTITLTNAVPIPNLNCLSFKIVIQGTSTGIPGGVGNIAAVLNFQNSPTTGNQAFNDNSATSISIFQAGPDLTPVVYAQPSLLYGGKSISVVVDVFELNAVATNGTVTVNVTRDPKFSLNFEPTASSIGGHSVQNSAWSFDDSSPDYYILTSNQAVGAGSLLSFGLNGMFEPGSTTGTVNISTVIMGSTGEQNLTNNSDADKIEYFQQ